MIFVKPHFSPTCDDSFIKSISREMYLQKYLSIQNQVLMRKVVFKMQLKLYLGSDTNKPLLVNEKIERTRNVKNDDKFK